MADGTTHDDSEHDAVNTPQPTESGGRFRQGTTIVAVVCLGLALLRVFGPSSLQIDDKTAWFIALAIVALVIDQITKFEWNGLKFEKEVRREVAKQAKVLRNELGKEVRDVEVAVKHIEKNSGLPGTASQSTSRPKTATPAKSVVAQAESEWDSDPNKGKFGGRSEANGRRLSAMLSPVAGLKSAACRVVIRVESTDPAKPLRDKVTVYLHPTFGRWAKYELDVKGGVATDEFTSWGVFTIGVEADGGQTKLELDLNDEKGGPPSFYDA